jgi:hypothetical protein
MMFSWILKRFYKDEDIGLEIYDYIKTKHPSISYQIKGHSNRYKFNIKSNEVILTKRYIYSKELYIYELEILIGNVITQLKISNYLIKRIVKLINSKEEERSSKEKLNLSPLSGLRNDLGI